MWEVDSTGDEVDMEVRGAVGLRVCILWVERGFLRIHVHINLNASIPLSGLECWFWRRGTEWGTGKGGGDSTRTRTIRQASRHVTATSL